MIASIADLGHSVLSAFQQHKKSRLFTTAISGIDGSGKGYITAQLQQYLESAGYKVANINIDPWQQPIPVRLQKENPAENFYRNVFRWNDFFEQLIIPLQQNKAIFLETQLIRTDADIYYPFTYRYENPDILLVEGICLLQEQYERYYDFKVWVECSFEEALKRAISRNAEQLDEERLRQDYASYYFAAQRLHMAKDYPKQRADIIFDHERLL